jgi:hypothetical protein
MQVSDIPAKFHEQIYLFHKEGKGYREIARLINAMEGMPKPTTHGGVSRLLGQLERSGWKPGDKPIEIPAELLPSPINTDGMIEVRVPIDLIDEDDPDEIRQKLDPAELALRVDGIRQTGRPWAPIFVYQKGDRYGRVGGKYRTSAYRVLLAETHDERWKAIPAYILGNDSLDLDVMRLADNAGRKENTSYEIARHLFRLKEKHKITTPQMLERFGKVGIGYTEAHINLLTRIYGGVHPDILSMWRDQHPFATQQRLARMLELGDTKDGKERQLDLVTRMLEGAHSAEWLEAQLDKLKDPTKKKGGPKSDTIGVRRSQVLIVREQIEKSRMATPIKRAGIALLDALMEGQESFSMGGVLINLPSLAEVKERLAENATRTPQAPAPKRKKARR